MISSGIFVLPGIAFAKAGPAVVLSYVLAGIFVIPTLFATSELLTAMPKAGGDYFYISRSMGAASGFLAGLANWFSLSCKSAFALVGIGAFLTIIYPDAPQFQMDFIAAAFCVFFTVINLRGVHLVAKYQIWLVSFLAAVCVIYILRGAVEVRLDHYRGFFDVGLPMIFSTAGLVFVSFGGVAKVASIAEEVKDPTTNIPLGMFLAWAAVVSIYVLAIFVTVGVMDAEVLKGTLTPLSSSAQCFAGAPGMALLTLGAVMAFVSTANAGIMTASRAPLAMSRDKLLPEMFTMINRHGVPHWPVLLTSASMLIMIFAFDIVKLVKVASSTMIILFIFANLAVIIMRESKLPNYQPVLKVPMYPYLPIAGILIYAALIVSMGAFAITSSAVFFGAALLWYLIYPYRIEAKKSALIHVVERVIGRQIQTDTLNRELKGVLRERDSIMEDRFDRLVKESMILDIEDQQSAHELFKKVSLLFGQLLKRDAGELYGQFIEREKISATVIKKGLAIPHIIIDGEKFFTMILVRARKGIIFPGSPEPVKTLFFIVASGDERNFYLRALMAIAEIVQEKDFEKKWSAAASKAELEDVILLASRKREEVLN